MKRWLFTALAALLIVLVLAWLWRGPMSPAAPPEVTTGLPPTCRDLVFEGVPYIVCDVGLDQYDVALRLADASGRPFHDLARLAETEDFDFATNAGMYHEDLSPVGLHVEEGSEHTPLNLADAEGNFFMKPNGVFYVDEAGNADVMESNAFARSAIKPRLATQSGPMLVIDGAIHPRFEHDGASRHIRNGVGVDGSGRVVFAISRQPVSLGSFARLFRDELECENALFFDGVVSALHDGTKYLVGGEHPTGPMLAVKEKLSSAAQ